MKKIFITIAIAVGLFGCGEGEVRDGDILFLDGGSTSTVSIVEVYDY